MGSLFQKQLNGRLEQVDCSPKELAKCEWDQGGHKMRHLPWTLRRRS